MGSKQTTLRKSLKGENIGLKARIDHADQQYKDTGHIFGLKYLEVLEEDPIKFDKFQTRLIAAVSAARETSKHVSGSPAGVGMGELLHLLALPEGEVVASSFGLTGHVMSFPLIVRHMAETGLEENPGFRDGDIWGTNDPLAGGPHQSDCYTYVPIFYDGELIAWAAGVNHIADTGHSICPGGVPAHSPTTYCDGFTYGPMKIGEDLIEYKWFERMWMRRTRTGTLNVLDEKMRLTGAIMLRGRVMELVNEFGLEYFKRATREILERERRAIERRVRTQMVPGEFRQSLFRPIRQKGMMGHLYREADKDWIVHMNETITIEPSSFINIDCDGSTTQDYFWANGHRGGILLGMGWHTMAVLVQSPLVNTSLLRMLDVKGPPGSIINPTRTDVSTCAPNVVGTMLSLLPNHVFGWSYFMRGFLEESYLCEYVYSVIGSGGVLKNGIPWGMTDFGYVGSSPRGPSPWRDGEAAMVGSGNPEADFGEAEEWEFVEPPLTSLSRKLIPDMCSHGKHRGSIGTSAAHLISDPGQFLTMNTMGISGTDMLGCSVGVCGGYPMLNGYVLYLHDTNAFELLEQGETLPTDFVEAWRMIDSGKLKVGSMEVYGNESPVTQLKHGDLVFQGLQASSAWGEPLDREFDLIKSDIERGWMTPETARKVYGAVVEVAANGACKVDADASAKARLELRNRRKTRAVPAKEFWARERAKVVAKDFSHVDVANMYQDTLRYEKWHREFYEFWQLSEDYKI
ncbi:MAG: hydantoinase B/oxoprolinase family protein [Rhodocyclaceae bacterium]|nr:hydantoinase B/oxoprolinase family protein [Rhodocyclaceae bacterium]